MYKYEKWSLGTFLLKRLILLSLWPAFCRCQVSVANWISLLGDERKGEKGKGKPITAHHLSRGQTNSLLELSTKERWSKMFCLQTSLKSRARAHLVLTVCFVQKKWKHKECRDRKWLLWLYWKLQWHFTPRYYSWFISSWTWHAGGFFHTVH